MHDNALHLGHMEPYVCHYFRKSDVLCSLSAAGRQRLSFEARGCWKFVALWKVITQLLYLLCTGLDNKRYRNNTLYLHYLNQWSIDFFQFIFSCCQCCHSSNFICRH